MYFKRIVTESIAHYSYLIGDGEELIVIDPQADIKKYLDIAREESMKITKILETHRNEDFLSGSKALSERTGAKVYNSGYEDLDYEYGEKIYEDHEFKLKDICIKTLHTPGHTLGHLSYILYFKGNPHMVFVGDTCLYGSIGRIDFYGKDKIGDMAEKMFNSIFSKLMPLGDHVIMWPGHGPGSACAENTEERMFTTLGYEKRYNPALQYKTKEEFIEKNSKVMYKPKYFEYMEEMNLKGISPIDCNSGINIKNIDDIDLEKEHLLDIRDQHSFNKIHIPNSIYIHRESIGSYINWIIEREEDICIVSNSSTDLDKLYIDLRRIGYTGEISFLYGGIMSWIASKRETNTIETILPKEFKRVKDDYFILDVRKESEVNKKYDHKNGMVIPMEEIKERYIELKDKKNIITVCPGGIRSNLVSSFLKSKGIESKVLIGGLKSLK